MTGHCSVKCAGAVDGFTPLSTPNDVAANFACGGATDEDSTGLCMKGGALRTCDVVAG